MYKTMKESILEPAWVGKTFDDFLFRPQKGITLSRSNISLTASLTSNISLELPIISSNMDSVTGRKMAETMALEGGLGVIHRGQSIEKQAGTLASNFIFHQFSDGLHQAILGRDYFSFQHVVIWNWHVQAANPHDRSIQVIETLFHY